MNCNPPAIKPAQIYRLPRNNPTHHRLAAAADNWGHPIAATALVFPEQTNRTVGNKLVHGLPYHMTGKIFLYLSGVVTDGLEDGGFLKDLNENGGMFLPTKRALNRTIGD